MPNYRTAVLIHGCHLQADLNGKPWEAIVWGDEYGEVMTLEGRGTMGIKVALEQEGRNRFNALVIFSTGASERDGVLEGQYTLDYARAHVQAIADATDSQDSVVEKLLRDHVEVDIESQNTRQECERNFRLCAERGIERVILVSSPWHIERSHAEALNVAEAMRQAGETVPEIVAIASHGTTEGLVMLEPPHRGDRPKTRFHELARRFFGVPAQDIDEFESGLGDWLSKFGA